MSIKKALNHSSTAIFQTVLIHATLVFQSHPRLPVKKHSSYVFIDKRIQNRQKHIAKLCSVIQLVKFVCGTTSDSRYNYQNKHVIITYDIRGMIREISTVPRRIIIHNNCHGTALVATLRRNSAVWRHVEHYRGRMRGTRQMRGQKWAIWKSVKPPGDLSAAEIPDPHTRIVVSTADLSISTRV